jgi:hypothetical protein
VVGANCFAGAWAKKHSGGESRQPGVMDRVVWYFITAI